MSSTWWTGDASAQERQHTVDSAVPQLVAPTRDAVFTEVVGRVASYTPEWTSRRPEDAGISLAHLFSEQMEPVLQRLNQLPVKSFVEFLNAGGVQPFPATPAMALLEFVVSDKATQAIAVPQGFQVQAPASGGGDPVVFETNNNLSAIPGTLDKMYALEKGLFRFIDPSKDDVPFQPFGAKPRPGNALFLGFSADRGADMGAQISLGFQVEGDPGQPPPFSSGGVAALPAPLAPLLQWDLFNGTAYRPLELISDDTYGLLQSGIISLRLPPGWSPANPQGVPEKDAFRWLRVQISAGTYAKPPVLLFVKVNMVNATAVRSIYNEVLTAVPNTGGSVWLLSQTPVLRGSLDLEVEDSADLLFTDSKGSGAGTTGTASTARKWKQVDDLSEFGPDAEVYRLDPGSGEVTFGDGFHGKAAPEGFRNIIARKYQVGGGAAGAVDAGKISSPVNSVPFLSEVKNPLPASGGTDAESQDQARLRGPKEIRACGRAVALTDYEVLALHAEGALVARAHAVSGLHPAFPGMPIPGVVCVFVVPPERGAGPPMPDAQALRAISQYLSQQLSPGGVDVVAAAPLYHRVRVQTTVVIDPAANRGAVVRDVLNLLDSYLDPIDGGDDGQGWPFGGTLSYLATVRKLQELPAVTAVERLNFVIDGVQGAICEDFPISPNSLVWPAGHEVMAVAPGDAP